LCNRSCRLEIAGQQRRCPLPITTKNSEPEPDRIKAALDRSALCEDYRIVNITGECVSRGRCGTI